MTEEMIITGCKECPFVNTQVTIQDWYENELSDINLKKEHKCGLGGFKVTEAYNGYADLMEWSFLGRAYFVGGKYQLRLIKIPSAPIDNRCPLKFKDVTVGLNFEHLWTRVFA